MNSLVCQFEKERCSGYGSFYHACFFWFGRRSRFLRDVAGNIV